MASTTQECWGCGINIPLNKDEPYCTVKCEREDHELSLEMRACCSGCYDYESEEHDKEMKAAKIIFDALVAWKKLRDAVPECPECFRKLNPKKQYKGFCDKYCYKFYRTPSYGNDCGYEDHFVSCCVCGSNCSGGSYEQFRICSRKCLNYES